MIGPTIRHYAIDVRLGEGGMGTVYRARDHPVHFAPRVRQPVLMVNGEDDFDLPYRTAQLPLFKALGTPEADKKLTVLKGGHMPPEPQLVFKEILDWLDKYLGPVAR